MKQTAYDLPTVCIPSPSMDLSYIGYITVSVKHLRKLPFSLQKEQNPGSEFLINLNFPTFIPILCFFPKVSSFMVLEIRQELNEFWWKSNHVTQSKIQKGR